MLYKAFMRDRAADRLFHRIDTLFACTLRGGTNAEKAWQAIRALRKHGCQLVFSRAKLWCSSSSPMKRTRAADVLAQLHRPKKPGSPAGSTSDYVYREQSFELISQMLQTESDLAALDSELIALGFLENGAAVPLLIPYASHANAEIRHAVTRALNNYSNNPLAVSALMKLADDPDKDNRDWAIFALGVIGNADSDEIRNIFVEHLHDPFADARVEAVASLGKRKDVRVVPALIRMIDNEGPGRVLLEAARDLLEMDKDPPDWYAKEYVAALKGRFPEMSLHEAPASLQGFTAP